MRLLYSFFIIIYFLFTLSCQSNQNHNNSAEDTHNHEAEAEHEHESTTEETQNSSEHNHENVKQQITAYSNDFELFAEADPFAAGENINILAHFTYLNNFKPIEKGSITASITVNGKTVSQKLDSPTRKGIFNFTLKPEQSGTGKLIFDITDANGNYQLTVDNIKVFADEHDAIHEAEEIKISSPNAISFTKEQSWKIDFGTQKIETKPFAQVIKTSAKVDYAPSDEFVYTAKSDGIAYISNNSLVEGGLVKKGQNLLQISGNELSENNLNTKYTEANTNFERAKLTYERNMELVKDKIISEKEFQESAFDYENAKAAFENLKSNFVSNGQIVISSSAGKVRNIWVKNGQAVSAGDPLLSISKNITLILKAGVQSKYASQLKDIESVNIRPVELAKTFTLTELNGKLISVGNSTSENSFLLPVTLQVDARDAITPGSFVELYINTKSQKSSLSVPNSALIEEQGYFAVFVQLTPELFEKREVEVGPTDGINTQIKKGLNNGDRVVTKGAILVKLAAVSNSLDPHAGHVH